MSSFFDFTIGNAITIVGGLVAWAMLWQRLQDKIAMNEKATEHNTKELNELTRMALQTTVAQHERRITTIETGIQALQVTLEQVKNDLSWIKDFMRKNNSIHSE